MGVDTALKKYLNEFDAEEVKEGVVLKVEVDIFAFGVIGVVRGSKVKCGAGDYAIRGGGSLPVGPALNKAQPTDLLLPTPYKVSRT